MRAVSIAVLAAALPAAFPAQSEKHAILDAVRPAVERQWGAPILFVVKELRTAGDYAFASFRPTRPSGRPIQMMLAGGMGAAYGEAYLRRSHGQWRVIVFRAGSSDAWECEYPGIPQQVRPSFCS